MKGRKTLLFVHGFGDSWLTFKRVFEDSRFDGFNIIVPDLVGYGRSSNSLKQGGYNFNSHDKWFCNLIRYKGLQELIVIGHSMGGDLIILLCKFDREGIVKKFVNIEGDLTQFDLFISSKAVKAHEDGRFDEWFKEFVNTTVY